MYFFFWCPKVIGEFFFRKKGVWFLKGILQTQRFFVLEDMSNSFAGSWPKPHKIRLHTFYAKTTTSAKLAGPIWAVSRPVLENQQKVYWKMVLGRFFFWDTTYFQSGWCHCDPSCHHLPPIFSNHRAFERTIAFMSPVAHYKACRPSPRGLGVNGRFQVANSASVCSEYWMSC